MTEFSSWVEKNRALWTRVYDEVIAPDFEVEWKKRQENHTKELEEKEENQQILFSHISDKIVKSARLAAENQQLKKQLQDQDGPIRSAMTDEPANAKNADVHETELRCLTEKYNELNKKYQDVSQKVKYLERKNSAVMQKNKDMKESVRAWQEYADRQSAKQKLKDRTRFNVEQPRSSPNQDIPDGRPHVPSSARSTATVRTPQSLAHLGHSSPAMMPLPLSITGPIRHPSPLESDEEGNSSRTSLTPKQHGRTQPEKQSLDDDNISYNSPSSNTAVTSKQPEHVGTYLQALVPGSSQTTEDENAEQITRVTQALGRGDDSDDTPQFVSERSLKRKRGQPSKIQIYADRSSDGTPAKPYRVKEEQYSSPPSIMHTLFRNETIDLDDPAPNVLQTPRRPKRTMSIHSNSTGLLRHQRSNSAPFSQSIKHDNPVTMATVTDLQALLLKPRVIPAETRAISEPSDPTQDGEAVLRLLDPNILHNNFEEPPNKRMRQVRSREGVEYRILGESGEGLFLDKEEVRLPPNLARAQFNRRFLALKDVPSPVKTHRETPKPASARIKLEQNPTPPSSASRSSRTPLGSTGLRKSLPKALPPPRDDPLPDNRPVWMMSTPNLRSTTRKPPRSKSPPKPGRLRDTPLPSLTTQDFKPNPAYNRGYTHAFSETVRKRADRLCLPGCTNPNCCGSTFRVFAAAQATLPASQEDVLLADYLGDAYSTMQLSQMAYEERAELVLQARTRKMAKDAGRHREAYEGRREPPGYWRVDFPTTQEQTEDREKAFETERGVVRERWLEAQRKGGRWVFRDE